MIDVSENQDILELEDSYKAEPLSHKVVQGGIWNFALTFSNRIIGFIRTIILARMLAPEDFGLFGIAFLAIRTLESFTQTGLDFALIQKKENIESYLDTSWTVSIIRGFILSLIIFLSAPLIANFFNSSEASTVIKVITISLLLNGSRNIGIVFFQKEFQFNKQFIYTLSYTITDLIVSITLAFMLRNVLALVWGSVAGNLMRLVMSYVMHPYRPRISFNKNQFKDLFGYGKWIFGSTILGFLIFQGDDIFVGKMIGTQALGLYQMAYLIANLPSTEISRVISQVIFPAFSKLQNETNRLKEAYIHALQIVAYISIPLAGGILILAPEIIPILLGKKWISMIPAVQALSVGSIALSTIYTTGTFFQGIGKPKIDTIWQTVRLFTLAIFIYPLTLRLNILGTSIAVVISVIVAMIGVSYSINKRLKPGIKRHCKMIILPMINTIFMMAIIFLLKKHIQLINIQELILLICVGFISYVFISLIYDKFFNYGILILIKEKCGIG